MASDIQTVRLLIGDNYKAAVNEVVGEGDGTNRYFQLDMFPLASAPSAVITLFLTGAIATTSTYRISGGLGRIEFITGQAPGAGHTILANYKYCALTSGELTDILSGLTGNPYLAAANACLVLAADASRFFAYTMGEKAVDKRKIATDLRELADDLVERHNTMLRTNNYQAGYFTYADNSGTPYDGYDTASAYLANTGTT